MNAVASVASQVTEQLRNRAQENIEPAMVVYREAVFAAAAGRKYDVAALAESTETLKLDSTAVDSDLKALARLDELDRWLAANAGPEKEAELTRQIECGARIEELEAELRKVKGDRANAAARQITIGATHAEIARIKHDHGRLWPTSGSDAQSADSKPKRDGWAGFRAAKTK